MKKEIYENGNIVEFLREVIHNHSGRGAYNVIMAKFNDKLQKKIMEMTSFLDEFQFINMKTRIYMLVNELCIDDIPHCCTCGEVIQ